MTRILAPLALTLAACADEPVDSSTPPPDPVQLSVRMENIAPGGSQTTSTGEPFDVMFAPGILVLHDAQFALYEPGKPILYSGFEDLAEDGNNKPLLDQIENLPGVLLARSYAALDEDYNSAPMLPGDSALLTEIAEFGAQLSVATMYGESNDVFAATPPEGVPLWDGEQVDYRSLTGAMALWDAGTEVNEEPGLGPNQPKSQVSAGAGEAESGVVRAIADVADGFDYPDPATVLRVSIEPVED